MRLVSALAILMPSNTSQKRSSDRTEPWEDHVPNDGSAACSQESVDTAALFLLDVFPPGIAISPSASTAAAATTAIPSFVVLVIVALVMLIFATAVDGLVLF